MRSGSTSKIRDELLIWKELMGTDLAEREHQKWLEKRRLKQIAAYRKRQVQNQSIDDWWKDYDNEVIYMTKFSEVYKGSSTSLKAEDLQGKARKLKIKGSFENEYDGKMKRVLEFENTDKTLVLNFTNGVTIESQCGDIENWPGNEIILYPTKVEFGGKMVDAIRVKEIIPDPDDDDIPF